MWGVFTNQVTYNVIYLVVCKEHSLNSCHWKWKCDTVLCYLDLWIVHIVLGIVHKCLLADYLWHKFNSMHKPVNCMMIYYVSKFCSLVHELFCELCCNYCVVHELFHDSLLMKLLVTMFINGSQIIINYSCKFMNLIEIFCKVSFVHKSLVVKILLKIWQFINAGPLLAYMHNRNK